MTPGFRNASDHRGPGQLWILDAIGISIEVWIWIGIWISPEVFRRVDAKSAHGVGSGEPHAGQLFTHLPEPGCSVRVSRRRA